MPRRLTPRRTGPKKQWNSIEGNFVLMNVNVEATSQQLLTGSPNSLSIRSTVDLGRRGSWIWSVAAVDLEGPESSSRDCDDDSGRIIIIFFLADYMIKESQLLNYRLNIYCLSVFLTSCTSTKLLNKVTSTDFQRERGSLASYITRIQTQIIILVYYGFSGRL